MGSCLGASETRGLHTVHEKHFVRINVFVSSSYSGTDAGLMSFCVLQSSGNRIRINKPKRVYLAPQVAQRIIGVRVRELNRIVRFVHTGCIALRCARAARVRCERTFRHFKFRCRRKKNQEVFFCVKLHPGVKCAAMVYIS